MQENKIKQKPVLGSQMSRKYQQVVFKIKQLLIHISTDARYGVREGKLKKNFSIMSARGSGGMFLIMTKSFLKVILSFFKTF